MLYLLLILSTFPMNSLTDTCNLKNFPQIKKKFYCDYELISNLTEQVTSKRKMNKYLKIQLGIFQNDVNKCKNQTANKNRKCLQRSVYESCDEAIGNGEGIYLLKPPLIQIKPFMAHCIRDPKGGKAWTLIQQRINNKTDFNQKWDKYRTGFGDLTLNFWLGLDKIHAITHNLRYELFLELISEHDKKTATYEQFAIAGPDKGYALYILGKYAGKIGDSLKAHSGCKFSTKDRKNEAKLKCVDGGWWFCGETCGGSNLNAAFEHIMWGKDDQKKYTEVRMGIREI